MAPISDHDVQLTKLDGVDLGVKIAEFGQAGWASASIRLLRPFSWDAKARGFEIVEIPLQLNIPLIVVCGPYATADAAAWNFDPNHDVGFSESEEHDGVIYLLAGEPATAEQRYQDAAGWFTIAGLTAADAEVAASVAVERSNTQLIVVELTADGLQLSLVLPKQVYPIASVSQLQDRPNLKVEFLSGGHTDATKLLRQQVLEAMPVRARDYSPPVIVDTWGFGTAVDQELVASVAQTAGSLGLDIITVDKGWEQFVGDWQTGSHFPDGVSGLAQIAGQNGAKLGLWAALGNADPKSDVATEHPEWLAMWRGRTQVVSHRTHSLCLGHGPVIEHLAAALDRLADQGLSWLLHDFETISRCDSPNHDHPAGLGEDWAVRGWYRLLSEFRNRHPNIWIENCWNGGRPLDLQVLAHHDTTIGDDWCDMAHNAVAKVGLGEYLPAQWCSSYMRDQDELPLRAQFATFAIGGPWILMGNIPAWSQEKLTLAQQVLAVHRNWRPIFAQGRVQWTELWGWQPDSRWRADQEVMAISFVHPDGRELMACSVTGTIDRDSLFWRPKYQGKLLIKDEFSGTEQIFNSKAGVGIELDASVPEGYLFSATPIPD
jgi:hypothetical protein